MSKTSKFALLALHVVLLCACVPRSASPSPEALVQVPAGEATVEAPTQIPSPTAAVPSPTAVPAAESDAPAPEWCRLVATGEIVAYRRPSLDAAVFATLSMGDQVFVEGMTEDGWIGFDPGVAQAANVGPFRLRWVQENGALTLEGACDDLPIVVGPPAGVCFTMSMFDIPVYAGADLSAEVIATMHPGDYAAVRGRTADDWMEVDLSVGSMELDLTGWIEGEMVNFNGPCGDLPTVTP